MLDPGRFTYAEGEPNLRHWFRGTAAHNTVTVDGCDQTPYARSRSSLPSAEATFLGRDIRDGLDILYGEVRSPVYEAIHRRRVILVDGAYWLIEDVPDRHAPAPLRPALPPRAPARAVHAARQGRAQLSRGGRLDLAAYGVRRAAPVVSAVAVGEHARFVTLLAPDARRARARRRHRSHRRGHDRARRAGDAAMIGDPAVPRRDALLRPETMAGVISQRLLGGVPVERCERVYVKYRVGESLRVVYRYDDTYVAARTGKRDGLAAPRSAPRSIPSPTTASWTWRRSTACSTSNDPPPRRVGRRAVGHVRVPRPVGTRGRVRQGAARRCTLAGTRRRPHPAGAAPPPATPSCSRRSKASASTARRRPRRPRRHAGRTPSTPPRRAAVRARSIPRGSSPPPR